MRSDIANVADHVYFPRAVEFFNRDILLNVALDKDARIRIIEVHFVITVSMWNQFWHTHFRLPNKISEYIASR